MGLEKTYTLNKYPNNMEKLTINKWVSAHGNVCIEVLSNGQRILLLSQGDAEAMLKILEDATQKPSEHIEEK